MTKAVLINLRRFINSEEFTEVLFRRAICGYKSPSFSQIMTVLRSTKNLVFSTGALPYLLLSAKTKSRMNIFHNEGDF